MTYINDVLLNLNKEKYNFFEWNDTDNIKYFKKVPVIRVSFITLHDFTNNKVLIKDDFFSKYNNCYLLYDDVFDSYECVVILTDGSSAAGLSITDNKIMESSAMALPDLEDVITLSECMKEASINYSVMEKSKYSCLTRKERAIKDNLFEEFKYLYDNKCLDKLCYYYYEYFDRLSDNIESVYKGLCDSLNDFNKKHIKLYEINNMSLKE